MKPPVFDKRSQTVLFVLGTYVATSAMVATFFALGMRYAGKEALVLAIASMLVPALVSVGLTKILFKSPLASLGLPPHFSPWYLLAILLPAVTSLLAMLFASSFPGVELDWDMSKQIAVLERDHNPLAAALRKLVDLPGPPVLVLLLSALPAGASINAAVALGEELGWRGYLHQSLEESFLKKSILTGLIWGVWHTPLVLLGHNDVGSKPLSVLLTIVFCLAWSPAFEVLRVRAKSVIACAVLHGTINASASIGGALTLGGEMWIIGPVSVTTIAAAALVSVVLSVLHLRKPQA